MLQSTEETERYSLSAFLKNLEHPYHLISLCYCVHFFSLLEKNNPISVTWPAPYSVPASITSVGLPAQDCFATRRLPKTLSVPDRRRVVQLYCGGYCHVHHICDGVLALALAQDLHLHSLGVPV